MQAFFIRWNASDDSALVLVVNTVPRFSKHFTWRLEHVSEPRLNREAKRLASTVRQRMDGFDGVPHVRDV